MRERGVEVAESPTARVQVDPVGNADRNRRGQLALRGDQLLVSYLRQGRSTLTAYRTDTPTPQWTAEVSTLTIDVSRCRPLLCLNDTHGCAR